MLQIKSLILYFLLLLLEISLNLGLDTGHKQNKFFEILLKKSLKFILNKKNSIVVFNLG